MSRHSRTGKLCGGGQPGASTGVVSAASDSSVRPSTTSRTVAIRSCRSASTSSSVGPRLTVPRDARGVGHLVPRQVQRVPRRRVAEDAAAHPRVGGEGEVPQRLDERPLAVDATRAAASGGSASRPLDRAAPTAARRRPTPRGSRPASVGRIFGRSGSRRSSSASTSGRDVDAVDGHVEQLAGDVDVPDLDPAHLHALDVDGPELGPGEVDRAEPGAGQVDVLEAGAGEVDMVEPPALTPGDLLQGPRVAVGVTEVRVLDSTHVVDAARRRPHDRSARRGPPRCRRPRGAAR